MVLYMDFLVILNIASHLSQQSLNETQGTNLWFFNKVEVVYMWEFNIYTFLTIIRHFCGVFNFLFQLLLFTF